jgi:mannose-6-phosphate isomerase-like protein (cupin superfamily)
MTRAHIVRKGHGDVAEPWVLKARGRETGGHFDFMVGDVEYHTGPPLHCHEAQSDSFFILNGTMRVQVDEEFFDIGPGDFITVPPGVPHTFDNIVEDQGPVSVINIMTPGGYDAALEAYAQAGHADTADPEEIRQIAARHGAVVLGPTLAELDGGSR